MQKALALVRKQSAKIGVSMALTALSLFGVVQISNAATDVPSATSTLATIMGIIITTTVNLATTIFTTYWPYILIIGVILGLIHWFKKLVSAGHK